MTGSQPYLTIVRGDATVEETAALVTALALRAAGRPPKARPEAANWRNPAGRMRVPLPQGRGAWRASFLPGAR